MLNDEDYLQAVNFVLDHEGGYRFNPFDKGGATNFGISLRFLQKAKLKCIALPSIVDVAFIKSLSREMAIAIYREAWWDQFRYGEINNVAIAAKIFDMSVNMGPSQAHKLCQRAINSLIANPIPDDGILGKKTLASLNYLIEIVAELPLIKAIKILCADFYMRLVKKDSTQQSELKGWLVRANSGL